MRTRFLKLLFAVSVGVVPVLVPGTAAAAPDHNVTLTEANSPQSWDGGVTPFGNNKNYSGATGEPCPDTPTGPDDYCEKTLLQVDVPSPMEVEVSLDDDPVNDFDFYIYGSDASGARGGLIDSSGESQTLGETATIPAAQGYYLIQVVYWNTVASGYTANAEIIADGGGGGGGPIPETRYYFHGQPPATGSFDTTAPTSPAPKVASGSAVLGVRFNGEIAAGTLNTLQVDFWQSAQYGSAAGEVHYEIRLVVGGVNRDFPFFSASVPMEVPSQVVHTFTPENSGGLLPMELPGGTVGFVIFGHFIDAEAGFQLYYDATSLASGFAVNVIPPVPHAPFPPDVDNPPGLQETLASNPDLGWTSRSEMHVAQNPLDPNMLIAGSKFYNLPDTDGDQIIDPLAEYEFKIGTYASFDRGRVWSDLGQLRTCPLADAPPESWPDENTCYPEDNPNLEGPEESGADLGEEYITSDPWAQFDDEGNAYFMVLDHPPFDGAGEGNGWGMTLHRWESVSQADVATGNTWSDRIPINFYDDENSQSIFLDDKNTFAVNNAGPDRDGQTGIMIACWGQSISTLVKQQIVCERSTDGGKTWPGQPTPISDVQHLVIGVHVIGDTLNPNTFYATWGQYATGGGAGDIGGALTPETLEFAVTTNGGQTWVHRPAPISTFTGIPRRFPDQSFRNLSIPIMAVGPAGEIYIAIAQYFRATDPSTDEDGMESNIVIYKSTNGGTTWSSPTFLPAEPAGTNVNADQFQPYIDVAETGQVNVTYFDRRLDPKVETPTHSGNYFTDVFLARTNDGGATWTEHRLTHDATDPEYNAPVSTSGLFFGDYQGLVVTKCDVVPFVNDTHLANDEFLDPSPGRRDPDFDPGHPGDPHQASPYQEAVNWRVPNTSAFGGPAPGLPPGCTPPVEATGEHLLTVSTRGTGGGTISSTPGPIVCRDTCSAPFPEGEQVTLRATPDEGSRFTGWSGDCSGTQDTCTVTMDAPKTVIATFERIGALLLVDKRGDGSGNVTAEGIQCGNDCSQTYAPGTRVTLRADADRGSRFVGWGNACSGAQQTCTITMDADKLVTATFQLGEAVCEGLEKVPGRHLVGTSGNDVLLGTPDRDVICGLGGNDRIRGGRGKDYLAGGSGNDLLRGHRDADELLGGAGRDRLAGGGDNDRLAGGGGNDKLFGHLDNDRLSGQGGNDNLRGNRGVDRCRGGPGKDKLARCEN